MQATIDLSDDTVLAVLFDITNRRKAAVSMSDLRFAVNDYTGQMYTIDHVKVRAQHMHDDGRAEIFPGPVVFGKHTWCIRPAGTNYEPQDLPIDGKAPITRSEVYAAKLKTREGDTVLIRIPGLDDDGAPITKDVAVKVVRKYPYICVFSNGKSAQWWQIAKYRRNKQVLDLR